jgi:cytochrome c biogenesis protein CcdA
MNDPTPASSSADDRATTFQAVPGAQPEHYNAVVLLVSAYALVFAVLVGWVALVWRKAGSMEQRLGELEREIDKAAGAKLAADK